MKKELKVVILAAGVGSRLRPLTSHKPKCMVKVSGKPILEHQIKAFESAGIKEIIIVAGYEHEKVRYFCSKIKNIRIKIIENANYENTNNMYSLYLAKQAIGNNSFVLTNGDVVFSPDIIRKVIKTPLTDFIVCDKSSYNEESMKITLTESGMINRISKEIPQCNTYATSIDLYKFSDISSKRFFEEMNTIIEKENNLKDWTEVALDALLQKNELKMKPFDISGKPWCEIDTYEDLAYADKAFSNFDLALKKKKIVFLDLDGTIYSDNKPIQGAQEFLSYLKTQGLKYYFISNNSSRAKIDYVRKLSSFGIATPEDRIVLSTDGVISYLQSERVKNIFLVGTRSMSKMFKNAGINTRSPNPEYVVVGYDTELTYEKIRKASLFLQHGIDMIASHSDVCCPTPDGLIPDIGSILSLFEKATNRKPVKVFGKPNVEMIRHITEKHRVRPEEIVIIGDRLQTDMELANRFGCDFICVLSGVTKRENIEQLEIFPSLIVNNLGHIISK